MSDMNFLWDVLEDFLPFFDKNKNTSKDIVTDYMCSIKFLTGAEAICGKTIEEKYKDVSPELIKKELLARRKAYKEQNK